MNAPRNEEMRGLNACYANGMWGADIEMKLEAE